MTREPLPKSVYKRLETDEELRKRFGAPGYLKGKELDDHIWDKFGKQRKFLDDFT